MTTISAVKLKLVEVATAALPDTQVIYGPPSGVTTRGPRLLCVEGVTGTRELASMGLDSTYERYTVQVRSLVSLPATDQALPNELALSDYTTLEAAVREMGDLGLESEGVMSALPTGEFELQERADENGRHSEVRFGVAIIAQT